MQDERTFFLKELLLQQEEILELKENLRVLEDRMASSNSAHPDGIEGATAPIFLETVPGVAAPQLNVNISAGAVAPPHLSSSEVPRAYSAPNDKATERSHGITAPKHQQSDVPRYTSAPNQPIAEQSHGTTAPKHQQSDVPQYTSAPNQPIAEQLRGATAPKHQQSDVPQYTFAPNPPLSKLRAVLRH